MLTIEHENSHIAPWLQSLWNSLDFENLPNAILLHGQSGIGKFPFAVELAKALLCESSQGTQKPCNQCEACHWFNTGNHPDFISLVPETHRKLLPHAEYEGDDAPKKGRAARDEGDGEASEKKEKKNISIEETRGAIECLSIGSHRGGNRIILIYPLEMLRSDSANTLLKSLEEPPPNTIFLLLADRVDRVLPTIRSRCRLLTAPRPDRQLGLDWLRDKVQGISGLKMADADIETIYDEQGGAPFSVLESLVARHNKDEKDELTISIQASRYLLQSMSQGARINWLDAAEKIHKARYSFLLATMQRWVSDLQSVAQGGDPRYYPKHIPTLQNLSKTANLPKLLAFWKSLTQARRHENHPLANRIQLEALLSQYQQLFGG
ncbi:DNA polymerase III subunit delta' [Polynucleobacter sp. AP-Kolm-20A-A1]|uniref:DNA polymerase III subunit delta' n=1 Tax=Polynucleobacter sp. AP-Kolm-20A-A1 TaxID=2081041 RepID=UPI001BFDE079|nr:DNA polymerase III subunit delta' [Polynucleobacter sp. AP-Kolm-20A-A1]QWE21529.1 DNA polymerase III subunit delta' [Polynucleobacter sp. AP-Kolm-20A-A1]